MNDDFDSELAADWERTYFTRWTHEDGRTAALGVYHHRNTSGPMIRQVVRDSGGSVEDTLGLHITPRDRKKITKYLDDLAAGLRADGFVFTAGESTPREGTV